MNSALCRNRWVAKDFQRRAGIICEVSGGARIKYPTPSSPRRSSGSSRSPDECLALFRCVEGEGEPGEEGQYLIVDVRDNGIGIMEGKIFDPSRLASSG